MLDEENKMLKCFNFPLKMLNRLQTIGDLPCIGDLVRYRIMIWKRGVRGWVLGIKQPRIRNCVLLTEETRGRKHSVLTCEMNNSTSSGEWMSQNLEKDFSISI